MAYNGLVLEAEYGDDPFLPIEQCLESTVFLGGLIRNSRPVYNLFFLRFEILRSRMFFYGFFPACKNAI